MTWIVRICAGRMPGDGWMPRSYSELVGSGLLLTRHMYLSLRGVLDAGPCPPPLCRAWACPLWVVSS